ncbi:MAG: PorT family protein [Flavobacteriales bacterium]|nr:PorT family protein [Flavobacteriales bacterium]
MNIRLVLLFTFVSLFIPGFSQEFRVGVLAGVNASQVSGDGYGGFDKAGILVGLYSNAHLSEKFDLQFEIYYSEKGSRRNPKTSDGDTDFFLLRMNYIEVPLMLRYHKKRFTYESGFYFSQLISDYLEDENGKGQIDPNLNQFKDRDLGFLVGVNYNFTEHLIMNWRLNSSIIPFRDHDSGGRFQFKSGMYHHYLSFTLRYEFLGK